MEGVPNWKLTMYSLSIFKHKSGWFLSINFFYLKPQSHIIWAYIYPNICRCMLTFSILQYLIEFILSNNVGSHFVFTYYLFIHPFRLVPEFTGITPVEMCLKDL
jgi:hypothetical protein